MNNGVMTTTKLSVQALADAPGNGETGHVIYDSTLNCGLGWHITSHYSGVLFTLYSSHDSAASGVIVECSSDGTLWYDGVDTQGVTYPKTYTQATDLMVTYTIALQFRHLRITYDNSANVLTAWAVEVMGVNDSKIA